MLRSIGIPARLANGYAQGERLEDGRFLVRRREAHAWPEVFFPGLGWVEFEPTVSQPEIFRLSGETNSSSNAFPPEIDDELRRRQGLELEQDRQELSNLNPPPTRSIWVNITIGLLGFALLTVMAFLLWKNRKRFTFPPIPIIIESAILKLGIQPPRAIQVWAMRSSLPPLTKSYQEINRALGRLGEPSHVTQTPAERAERLGDLLPPAQPPTQRLLDEYQIAIFSQQTPDYNTARHAQIEIRSLSIKAWFHRFLKRFQTQLIPKRTKFGTRFPR